MALTKRAVGPLPRAFDPFRAGAARYTPDEVDALRATLLALPGIADVRSIERHPRGGYATQVEVAAGAVDEFFRSLAASDWASAS